MTAQLDPSGKRVERLDGAKIQLKERADSPEQLGDFLRSLVAPDVKLAPSKTETVDGAMQVVFEQTTRVGDETLPVFGAETRAYIDKDRNLVALQSSIIPPSELQSAPAPLWAPSVEDARRFLIDTLGLSKEGEDEIVEIRKGVYLPEKDPAKARVGFEVRLKREGEQDVKLYLDCASLRPVAAK
jgi:hypothetical protein